MRALELLAVALAMKKYHVNLQLDVYTLVISFINVIKIYLLSWRIFSIIQKTSLGYFLNLNLEGKIVGQECNRS